MANYVKLILNQDARIVSLEADNEALRADLKAEWGNLQVLVEKNKTLASALQGLVRAVDGVDWNCTADQSRRARLEVLQRRCWTEADRMVEDFYALGMGGVARSRRPRWIIAGKEWSAERRGQAMRFKVGRLCGACGRQIPLGGGFDCGTDHAPTIRCPDCGNEIDPEWCHCGDAIKAHRGMSHNHSPVPMGCSCGYSPAAPPSGAQDRGGEHGN